MNDGMSQRELAERAGVPVTMISAYERDQRQPTLTTLAEAAARGWLRSPPALGGLRIRMTTYLPGWKPVAPNRRGVAAMDSFRHGARPLLQTSQM
jgi:transcriptional regulator with XRE-family HTH domain